MTSRNVRILAAALAVTTGLAAVISGSLTSGLVFAAAFIAALFAFAPLLRFDPDLRGERRAGRGLEPEGP